MRNLAVIALLALGLGCNEQCREQAPAIRLDLKANPELASTIRSLRIELTVAEERRSKAFEVEREISDGATALRIDLEPSLTSAVDVDVTVHAFDGPGGVGTLLGYSTGHLDATPDGCNTLTLDITREGPDAGVDGGFSDADGGPVDRGFEDLGDTLGEDADAGFEDLGSPDDVGSPDATDADLGYPDATDAGFPDATDVGFPDAGTCSNGIAEGAELCDGQDLRGMSCMELGFVSGRPTCNGTCSAIDTSPCSNSISSASDLAAAVASAIASEGHEVVAIPNGNYELGIDLTIDECVAGCPGGPDGVTLRPLNGSVTIEGTIQIRSGNVTVEGLRFSDESRAIRLRRTYGADSGHNVIKNNRISRSGERVEVGIDVESDDNQILSNWVESTAIEAGEAGIRVVSARRTTLAMNVVRGNFVAGIMLERIPASTGAAETTRVDHNSVLLTGAGVSMTFADSQNLCARANVLAGSITSTAVQLENVVLATSCPGTASGNNDNFGHGTACWGNGCAACMAGGAFCSRQDNPGFAGQTDMCLRPAGNPMINAGIDLGLDHDDVGAGRFNGVAPDLGAREAGVARTYGGQTTTCP
ncbi:MAG: right-handed parallel beta-helix repeat-containing protein [Deltaproteobacteria bacterium]|nr:right-handed parallel beta-helix repeat-containing protein [Deltaproteobacteria bacterium]